MSQKRYKCIDQLCVRRVHIVKLGRKSLIGHISINSSVRTMTTHSDLSTTIITSAGYEPSRRFKFHKHGEFPSQGVLLLSHLRIY